MAAPHLAAATWLPQVCDIKALAEIAHAAGAICLVDNSFMSPIFQRPLELGADISMISGTKFIGGHSDVTCGVLSVGAPPWPCCHPGTRI
jgi:cystathionine beta-lyase/cystathionine gamma-synthase